MVQHIDERVGSSQISVRQLTQLGFKQNVAQFTDKQAKLIWMFLEKQIRILQV